MEQYHLSGPRNSGRAVRVESLDYIAVSKNLDEAVKFVSENSTYGQLKKKEWMLGIAQFVKEVSDPCKDPFDPSVKWRKVTVADFEEGFSAFFNAKDMMMLEALYREYHDLTKEELDAITGKGKPVASAG